MLSDIVDVYNTVKSQAVQYVGYWPILAGGAVRDVLAGSEPRDWDFYVNAPLATLEAADQFYDTCGLAGSARPSTDEYYNGLVSAGHYNVNGLDINIVLVGPSRQWAVADQFDLVSSLGQYNGHFSNLDAVAEEIANRRISINFLPQSARQSRSTIKRIAMLHDRYGWSPTEDCREDILRMRLDWRIPESYYWRAYE